MDIVLYALTDYCSEADTNPYNCHLCKAKYSSYPEVNAHYLTAHKNVVVCLKDEGQIKIQRHFVGPKSKNPLYKNVTNSKKGDIKKNLKRKTTTTDFADISTPLSNLFDADPPQITKDEDVQIEGILDKSFSPEVDNVDNWKSLENLITESSDEMFDLENPEQLISTLTSPIIPSEYSLISLKCDPDEVGGTTTHPDDPPSDIEIDLDEVLEFALILEEQFAQNAATSDNNEVLNSFENNSK